MTVILGFIVVALGIGLFIEGIGFIIAMFQKKK